MCLAFTCMHLAFGFNPKQSCIPVNRTNDISTSNAILQMNYRKTQTILTVFQSRSRSTKCAHTKHWQYILCSMLQVSISSQLISLCKLACDKGCIWLRLMRRDAVAVWAQNTQSARPSSEQKLRLCGTALRHPGHLAHREPLHISPNQACNVLHNQALKPMTNSPSLPSLLCHTGSNILQCVIWKGW